MNKAIKYICNWNYFEKIDTEEKAYWLGFLYADGCVYFKPKKEYRINLHLECKDINHIIKFKQSINATHKIRNYNRTRIRNNKIIKECISTLDISSEKMVNDLIKHHCVPNKTLILKWPQNVVPDNLKRHFIRGIIDGDGDWSIEKTRKNMVIVELTSTKDMCENIRNWIYIKCGRYGTSNIKKRTKANAYRIRFENKIMTHRIYHLLYNDSTIFMNRKRKIASIMSRLEYNGNGNKAKMFIPAPNEKQLQYRSKNNLSLYAK